MYPDVFFRIFPSYIYFLPPLIFFSPQYTLFTSFDIFSLFSQLKFFFLARFLFPQQQAQLHRCPLFPIRSSIYAYPRVFHLFPLPPTPRLVISSYLARHNAFSSFPITFTRHHPSTFPFSQFLPPFSTLTSLSLSLFTILVSVSSFSFSFTARDRPERDRSSLFLPPPREENHHPLPVQSPCHPASPQRRINLLPSLTWNTASSTLKVYER